MGKLTTQQQVYTQVRARGYRAGWTAMQFAARQVAKLAEELAELSRHVQTPPQVERYLALAGAAGKSHFDDTDAWPEHTVCAVWAAQRELADIQVVVFCLAEALGEIAQKPFDVVDAALEKAGADIQRGVRE